MQVIDLQQRNTKLERQVQHQQQQLMQAEQTIMGLTASKVTRSDRTSTVSLSHTAADCRLSASLHTHPRRYRHVQHNIVLTPLQHAARCYALYCCNILCAELTWTIGMARTNCA